MADIENEGRVLAGRVDTAMYQLRLRNTDIERMHQFHQNTIDAYNAFHAQIDVVDGRLAALESFYNDNQYELGSIYASELRAQIAAYTQDIAKFREMYGVPTLTREESAREYMQGTVVDIEDGDTLIFEYDRPLEAGSEKVKHRIRIAGIDCTEVGTDRGLEQLKFAKDYILNKEVELFIDDHNPLDVYARVLAKVVVNGVDFSHVLQQDCWCKPQTKFGKHKYVDPELNKSLYDICDITPVGQGVVHVYSNPTQAKIYIDGSDIFKITPAKVPLSIGKHEIMVTYPDHSPDSVTLDIKRYVHEVKLYPKKMPISTGDVSINSNPLFAEIWMDDKLMGFTPTTFTLAVGQQYKFIIRADGYQDEEFVANPVLGSTIEYDFEMKK